MMSQMGIYQHHDAVAGTARQDVADDYVYRLNSAMHQNNQFYGAIADIELQKLTGMTTNGTFEFCE
jgi:hypothetical protein